MGCDSSRKKEDDFNDTSSVYYIDNEIINLTIQLRKDNKIKMPDAIVTATAMVYDLTLLTRNTSDFKNIKNLKMENPWDCQNHKSSNYIKYTFLFKIKFLIYLSDGYIWPRSHVV